MTPCSVVPDPFVVVFCQAGIIQFAAVLGKDQQGHDYEALFGIGPRHAGTGCTDPRSQKQDLGHPSILPMQRPGSPAS
jgi:hypothetical protein